jgi:hypothetical protein
LTLAASPAKFVPTRPEGRGMISMRWLSLLFMHWPMPVELVRQMRPRIPDRLQIDTFEGQAWIGLVPFTMRDFGPVGVPSVPSARHFHECNVRTYVTCDGRPGVWFFSLDAASRLAVWGARRFFHLPYFHAAMSLARRGDEVRYSTARRTKGEAGLRCSWRIGRPRPRSQPGDLAHFLTERYELYAASPRGEIFRGRIWHDPWPLREAELLEFADGLLAAAGMKLPRDAPPAVLYHADELDVRAWRLERV